MISDKIYYQGKYEISTRDADFKKELRYSSLINFFIQGAWKHAEDLGFGYSQLSEIGVGWVLSRFTIKIEKLPSWPDNLSITTWPKGMDRIMYVIDAEVRNSREEIIATITSAWLVIDIKTKRLTRSFPEADYFAELKTRSAIDDKIPALKCEGEPSFSNKIRVNYNDIDLNMHLTTIRYIDFMFDTYDIAFLRNNAPKEFTVNFLKEVSFGTDLIINRVEKDDVHSFELTGADGKIVYFRGEIKY